jgi:hypothetical protein
MRLSAFLNAGPILAELPKPDSPESVGWIIIILGGLVMTAYYCIMAWKALFPAKVPPDHEVYATRSQLLKLEVDMKGDIKRVEERFEEWLEQQAVNHKDEMTLLGQWKNELQGWQRQMERALGHVETKADLALEKGGSRKNG